MSENKPDRQLNTFQIRDLRIMTVMLELGAVDDRILDSLHESELDYFELENKYKVLEEKVNIDEKTSLLKFKKGYMTNILKTASRIYHGMHDKQYNIAFVRFDIDDFSNFNTRYGHEAGDLVLIETARTIRENSRPTDYVIRFGGEEIDVILPSTDIEGAAVYAEKVVSRVRDLNIVFEGEELHVTVSAGLTATKYSFDEVLPIQEEETEEIYRLMQSHADDALYEAKSTGKDRCTIFEEDKKSVYQEYRRTYKKNPNENHSAGKENVTAPLQ